MAVSFVAKGAFASGTGGVSPAIPSGMSDGDLMVLVVHSVNEAITGPTGWTAAPAFPSHSGTAERGTAAAAGGVRVRVFTRWWQSGDGAPSVADTGNLTAAQIFGFRGVDPSDPFDSATPIGFNAAASTTLTLAGITTNSANAMVVHAVALDRDAADTSNVGTASNANLTSLTEQHDQTVTAGQGGGLYLATGFKASAGATGDTSTASGDSTAIAGITFALKEAPPPAPYPDDGWTHRAPIVLQQSAITGSSDITDMPVLITHASIPDDFLDSDLFQSDGGDIRFSLDEEGAEFLAVDLVSFSGNSTPSSARAKIFVKAPIVEHDADTTIYMWRKTGSGETQEAAGHAYGRNAVYSGNGLRRVYHGADAIEATGNGASLTPSGGGATYTTTNAKIGAAFSLNGSSEFTGDSNSDIDNLQAITVLAWGRPTARSTVNDEGTDLVGKPGSPNGWEGWSYGERQISGGAGRLWTFRTDDAEYSAANAFTNGNWTHAAFTGTSTFTNAARIGYVNGAAVSMTSYQEDGNTLADAGSNLLVGEGWNGLIEEVWIANTTWSADLIQAVYANQNDPGAFAIAGAVEEIGAAAGFAFSYAFLS